MVQEGGILPVGTRKFWVVVDMFIILIVAIVLQLYTYVRSYKTVHFINVEFIVS